MSDLTSTQLVLEEDLAAVGRLRNPVEIARNRQNE